MTVRFGFPALPAPPGLLSPPVPYLGSGSLFGGGSPFDTGSLSSLYSLGLDPYEIYSMDPDELEEYLLDLMQTGIITGASYTGIMHSLACGGRRRPRRLLGRRKPWGDRWYDDGYGGLGLGYFGGWSGGRSRRGLGLGGGFGSLWWPYDGLGYGRFGH